jgi:hypothetical protein
MILYWTLQNEEVASEARERIIGELTPDARSYLESLDREGRRRQVWRWIRDSLQPKWGQDELQSFFAEELDNNQRERLLHLPPGEMHSELERLYVAEELGFRGLVEPGGGPWNPPGPNRLPFRFERDEGGRRGPPPPDFRDRDRHDRGPDGPPGPRRGDREGQDPRDRRGPPRDGRETI